MQLVKESESMDKELEEIIARLVSIEDKLYRITKKMNCYRG